MECLPTICQAPSAAKQILFSLFYSWDNWFVGVIYVLSKNINFVSLWEVFSRLFLVWELPFLFAHIS